MKTLTRSLLAVALALPFGLSGCGALSSLFGTASGTSASTAKTTSTSSSSSKSREELLVNGQPVEANDDDDAPPKAKKTAAAPAASNKKPLKATCHKNTECESEICWVGSGSIGYCTNMCDDDFGCNDFWKCIKPGNAPQRICVQPDN